MIACLSYSLTAPVIKNDRLTEELVPQPDHLSGYMTVLENEREVVIGFVMSRQKGSFRRLVEHLWSKGYTVKIPIPLAEMERICRKEGFVQTTEYSPTGPIEVWVKGPPNYDGITRLP